MSKSPLGKRKAPWGGVVLVARVHLVEKEMEADQPLIHILRRVIHGMVVVPQGAHRLRFIAVVPVGSGYVGSHARIKAGPKHGVVVVPEL